MTRAELSSRAVAMLGVAILAGACSSTNLTTPKHDSGADVTVVAQRDSGGDAVTAAPNDASDAHTTPVDSGADAPGLGGCSGHAPTASEVPQTHRATAVACPPNPNTSSPVDGMSCTSNADCYTSPTASLLTFVCLHGRCSLDSCLTDADCGDTGVCDCAQKLFGVAAFANTCRPANCHVDSDCGPGRYCSGNSIDSCGRRDGYYCQGPNDTCVNREDCPCGKTCEHTPTTGAFTCVAVSFCGG